jgi:hypothetical protein
MGNQETHEWTDAERQAVDARRTSDYLACLAVYADEQGWVHTAEAYRHAAKAAMSNVSPLKVR